MKYFLIVILLFPLPGVAQTTESCEIEQAQWDNILLQPDSSDTEKIYDFCEKNAEYPGGPEQMYTELYALIEYPKHSCIQGRVFIEFIIDTSGVASDFKVLKGMGDPFDQNALEAVKQLKPWIPAEQDGQKVKQRMRIPIKFVLQ